ncbi:hypothetical protein D9M69_670840 [compost metagenome]
MLLHELDLVHHTQLLEDLAHDERLVLGAQAAKLVQRDFELEVAAYEGCGATTWNVVPFQQKGPAATALQCGGCRQPGIAGADHNGVIVLHDLPQTYQR